MYIIIHDYNIIIPKLYYYVIISLMETIFQRHIINMQKAAEAGCGMRRERGRKGRERRSVVTANDISGHPGFKYV